MPERLSRIPGEPQNMGRGSEETVARAEPRARPRFHTVGRVLYTREMKLSIIPRDDGMVIDWYDLLQHFLIAPKRVLKPRLTL